MFLHLRRDHAAAISAYPSPADTRRRPCRRPRRFVAGLAAAVFALPRAAAQPARLGASMGGGNHDLRDRSNHLQGGLLPRVSDAEGEARSNDGTGQIGDDCYRNDFCASGHCSSNLFFSGFCVECLSNDDCEGQGDSLPGVLPKAFCVESEGELPVCSRWKNGHPIGERGYPVWLGHEDIPPVWLERKVHEGPPTSLVWRFDLNNQVGGAETGDKFGANATHVRIPLEESLVAGYSMSNPMLDDHETGVVSLFFAFNPQSVVTPYAQSGTGEKYHTLTHDGPMDESHKRRVSKELQERSPAVAAEAVNDRLYRTQLMAVAMGAVGISGMLVEATQDVVNLEQLRAFVHQLKSGDAPPKDIVHADMRAEAAEALELAKTLPSLKSNNHCTHFEKSDEIRVTESHVEFPLNSPMVFVKGITEFIPAHYFGLNAGLVVAHYDAEARILEFHFEMTQSARLYPYEPTSPKNGLWLGSNDDATAPADSDGRSDEFYEDDVDYYYATNELFRRYLPVPIDYSAFDSPSGTCDQETADAMSPLWPEVPARDSGNIFNAVGTLRLATQGITCGSTFLRGDAHEGLVGIDILEFAVWGHMLLEQTDSSREAMCTADWYDDWDVFYKAQAKAL